MVLIGVSILSVVGKHIPNDGVLTIRFIVVVYVNSISVIDACVVGDCDVI